MLADNLAKGQQKKLKEEVTRRVEEGKSMQASFQIKSGLQV